MHTPEKKDSTMSAIALGSILGFSASIFLGQKLLQPRPVLCHDRMSFVRKDSEFPHRVDGKASLLFSLIERTMS